MYKFTAFGLVISMLLSNALFATNKTTINDQEMANKILYYINQYRNKHGLNSLTLDTRMSKEAQQHSQDMATHRQPFGHQQFMQRIKRLHKQIKLSGAAAENVAYNYKDARDVVTNWLRSPGHKRNIDGHYNLTGIGTARDAKGKIYFTQIFISTQQQTQRRHRAHLSLPFKVFLFH